MIGLSKLNYRHPWAPKHGLQQANADLGLEARIEVGGTDEMASDNDTPE